MSVLDEIRSHTEETEKIIRGFLPEETGYQKTVLEAVNYSFLAGGKRLRPMLMLETYRLFGGRGRDIEPLMAAIEMIHTSSLIHDDLPAMDDDEYRRGRKTTHIVYGEANAILAGDGLLLYAFETAVKALELGADAGRIARAMGILASKSGIFGMVGGQTVDVETEGQRVTEDILDFIYDLKTSALIEAAMMIGAVLAGASDDDVKKIERIANALGRAFQIRDDILDIAGDEALIGKPVGSDEKNEKTTYARLVGLQEADRLVEKNTRIALDGLHELCKKMNIGRDGNAGDGDEDIFLGRLFVALIDRKK